MYSKASCSLIEHSEDLKMLFFSANLRANVIYLNLMDKPATWVLFRTEATQ